METILISVKAGVERSAVGWRHPKVALGTAGLLLLTASTWHGLITHRVWTSSDVPALAFGAMLGFELPGGDG